MTFRIDKLGVVIAALLAYGTFLAPFATFRANRIVPGEARGILEALPAGFGAALLGLVVIAIVLVLLKTPTVFRLVLGLAALLALAILVGLSAGHLTPPENTYARVSPASGFWLLSFAFSLLTADALARLRLSPLSRVALLAAAAVAAAGLLMSGAWDGLSILNIGVTTRPKGGEADAWVVHAAPTGTRVATRITGADWGDPDLVAPVRRHAPRLVFTGHVHAPRHWCELRDGTLFLNPGMAGADAPFPNHILVETDTLHCRFVNAAGEETFAPRFPASRSPVAEDATTAVA